MGIDIQIVSGIDGGGRVNRMSVGRITVSVDTRDVVRFKPEELGEKLRAVIEQHFREVLA